MTKPAYLNKIVAVAELADRLETRRRAGESVVFTNGCFDLLHSGHTRYLAQAAGLGDFLVVGFNSDASVRAIKDPSRPIRGQEERAETLAALASVDFIVVFDEETPLNLIEQVGPDVLVKGGDWSVGRIVGGPEVLARGGKVFSLPFFPGESTTVLISRIQKKTLYKT